MCVAEIYDSLYTNLGDLDKPDMPGGSVPIVLGMDGARGGFIFYL